MAKAGTGPQHGSAFDSQHPRGTEGRFTKKRAADPTSAAVMPALGPRPVQDAEGRWGLAPDERFPEEVEEFTTDFGPCACGGGRMQQNDEGQVNHEDGVVGYVINCSDTGDLLGGADYDIDPDTGGLTTGRVQWYEMCAGEPQPTWRHSRSGAVADTSAGGAAS